jgi:hypothetical protein
MSATDENGLVVVHVRDAINAALAGHEGRAYTSPPQPHAQALALVELLLGCAAPGAEGQRTWTVSVAGGRRTITLAPARDPGR